MRDNSENFILEKQNGLFFSLRQGLDGFSKVMAGGEKALNNSILNTKNKTPQEIREQVNGNPEKQSQYLSFLSNGQYPPSEYDAKLVGKIAIDSKSLEIRNEALQELSNMYNDKMSYDDLRRQVTLEIGKVGVHRKDLTLVDHFIQKTDDSCYGYNLSEAGDVFKYVANNLAKDPEKQEKQIDFAKSAIYTTIRDDRNDAQIIEHINAIKNPLVKGEIQMLAINYAIFEDRASTIADFVGAFSQNENSENKGAIKQYTLASIKSVSNLSEVRKQVLSEVVLNVDNPSLRKKVVQAPRKLIEKIVKVREKVYES